MKKKEDPRYSNRLLKANDVARILNISDSFAYQLMSSREIPTIQIGRSRRVHSHDLETFIDKNRVSYHG